MNKTNGIYQYKTVDLFAGIGGIRLGFENAGFKTVFANDFDKHCKVTYDANFENPQLVVEDIKKIKTSDLPEFDFLLGGFPCQAFSIAGYQKGFNDERGNLFFEIARILDEAKPIGFMLENVKNLQGHDHGNTFRVISETVQKLGYHMKHAVLNTKDYSNAPQNRERIYMVGFRDKKLADNFAFPDKIHRTNEVIDILEDLADSKFYYNGKPLFERIRDHIVKEGKVYQWRRKYVRENKNGVCPTLTANMGTGGHNVPIIKVKDGIRKLTPRECARLQGFPDDFKLPESLATSKLYKQIGNSVTVPVIEAIAKQIQRVLKGEVLATHNQMPLSDSSLGRSYLPEFAN